jgi:hypothetical protein
MLSADARRGGFGNIRLLPYQPAKRLRQVMEGGGSVHLLFR